MGPVLHALAASSRKYITKLRLFTEVHHQTAGMWITWSASGRRNRATSPNVAFFSPRYISNPTVVDRWK